MESIFWRISAKVNEFDKRKASRYDSRGVDKEVVDDVDDDP
jgi:hypothetical protein